MREKRRSTTFTAATGIIYDDESGGGSHIELRAGVVYDTRDNEPDPSCGLYADLLLYGSPDIIDRRGYHYLKAAVSFRHYLPLIRGKLVFAYRLCWQGTVAGRAPFYVQQNYATLFLKQINSDILGGAISLRGILYNRVVGDGMAWANAGIAAPALRFPTFRTGVVHHHESLFRPGYRHPSVPGQKSCRPSGTTLPSRTTSARRYTVAKGKRPT